MPNSVVELLGMIGTTVVLINIPALAQENLLLNYWWLSTENWDCEDLFCYPNVDSSDSYCGERRGLTSYRRCECDPPFCEIYRDCCFDFGNCTVPANHSSVYYEAAANELYPEFECMRIPVSQTHSHNPYADLAVLLIRSCLDSNWPQDKNRRKCESPPTIADPSTLVPVETTGGILYSNKYCVICSDIPEADITRVFKEETEFDCYLVCSLTNNTHEECQQRFLDLVLTGQCVARILMLSPSEISDQWRGCYLLSDMKRDWYMNRKHWCPESHPHHHNCKTVMMPGGEDYFDNKIVNTYCHACCADSPECPYSQYLHDYDRNLCLEPDHTYPMSPSGYSFALLVTAFDAPTTAQVYVPVTDEQGSTVSAGEQRTSRPWLQIWGSDITGYLTIALLSLSIACLVVCLTTYALFPELRNVHGKLLVNFFLALLLAQGTFLVRNGSPGGLACLAFSVVQHYLWLGVFVWMTTISVNFSRTFNSSSAAGSSVLPVVVGAWLAPCTVVAPCVTLHLCDCTSLGLFYGVGDVCWISGFSRMLVVFIAPLALSILISAGCFVVTVVSIQRAASSSSKKSNMDRLKIYAKLATVVGLPWVVGVIIPFIGHEQVNAKFALDCMFSLLNATQGLYLLNCFIVNKRVVDMWRKKLGS